jgi:hypothetical protein
MNEGNPVMGVSFSCGSALLRWNLAIIVSVAGMVCTEGAVVSAQWVQNPANGHSYRLTSAPLDIGQARIEASLYGGYLVAINDAAENQFILDFFTTPATAETNLWIGLSDELVEDTYLWDNGEPFNYQNWMGVEPNDLNDEDYAEMNTNPSGLPTANYGRWNDTDGYINQKYGLIERDSGSFIRPDCNADGAFNIADAIKILSVLFSGGLSPDCLDACDANDDGSLNLSDAVMMLNALYVPGSAPIPLPNPGCSIDPTDDTLDCNGYTCP